ncbi:putative histone deacetylase complex subunit cti6 [Choanephora cucurbitarum]|uniref:Putative histone deacetylase complex subunit cti6 n=1 Tax=Choanephora cucurbitarum TaxID=101091 RepID=A0A1C7N531_9FUNG|nr:putative histone deacetylase complex subunit cti6 [Choanephora cucurbitarum]
MVAHSSKRSGRQSVGRKKRQPRRRSQSTSDENSTDSSSVTRCICGHTHSLGLMVQCDKCEVWQHCECMGLEPPDIPDQYYCEQCKPENHKHIRYHHGRSKRYYVASEKSPKKRTTLNSREASMSLEDVLAAKSALEMYESHMHDDPLGSLTEEPVMEEEQDMKPMASPESEPQSIKPKPSVKRKTRPTDEKIKKGLRPHKRKTRSRTATPIRELSPATPECDEEACQAADSISLALFDYFSPQARAASPPAKTRPPHARMSLSDMNRRANQILEYISSIQVEMASKTEDHAGHGTSHDDSCSLSSASTLPLDHVIQTEQTSMDIMDMLTRKLIQFQRRFGPQHPIEISEDGPDSFSNITACS